MAGPTRAPGYTDYSSSSVNKYIKEVYSGKLVTKTYASTCLGDIASTEYQGEIKSFGDNIIIRTTPDIVVSDYAIGSGFTNDDYQAPSSSAVELAINRAKKFLVRVNTVDEAQSDIDMASVFADDGSMQLKIAMDKDVLGNIFSQVSADNQGTAAGAISHNANLGSTTPVLIDETNVIAYILKHGQVLDEQNVSDEGRWIVLPSWMIQKLKLSPLKNANEMGDSASTLRNGKVGMIDRFTVYRSNNLTVTDATNDYTNIISGHPTGLAWAAQITEFEKQPNPYDFGFLMRGLCVYGYKVIEPKYLSWGRVYGV